MGVYLIRGNLSGCVFGKGDSKWLWYKLVQSGFLKR